VGVVTGEMFAPVLSALLQDLRLEDRAVEVIPVANEFFGRAIGVAGLLTGRDILAQLSVRAVADTVLIPAVALKDGENVFLDDLAPEDLATHLGVPVKAVEPTPRALLRALFDG